MIDVLIPILQASTLLGLLLAFTVAVLIVMMVLTDLDWYIELIESDFPNRRAALVDGIRVIRHRRTIAFTLSEYRAKKSRGVDVEDAKAKLRKEKEESAREGFFDEFYTPGFDSEGNLYYHNGIKFPT